MTTENFNGLHVRQYGSGPAIVLIHGFPDTGATWEQTATKLAERWHVIVPDLPGAGGSPLDGDMSLAEMAEKIQLVLDGLGVGRALLAGHSMGGYVALAFARQWPHMVAGLSLVHSTPLPDDAEKKKTRQKAIGLILNGGKEAFIKQMTSNLFAASFREAHPDVIARKAAAGAGISTEALVNFYKAMMGRPDSTEVTANAAFPVQWVLGSEDNVISFRASLALCHKSPVNFVHLYEGCGHMSMLERPGALIADLEQFAAYCYNPGM